MSEAFEDKTDEQVVRCTDKKNLYIELYCTYPISDLNTFANVFVKINVWKHF